MNIYVVKEGDTVSSIAKQYGVTPQFIIDSNELNQPNDLVVGQNLVIIKPNKQHTVVAGDSMFKIANLYAVSLMDLVRANPQIDDPLNLQIGSLIVIPEQSEKLGTIEVNGYCFPNISKSVLNKTLPYLTYLSIFGYEIKPDGSLKGLDGDKELIDIAKTQSVASLMVLSNIDETGAFSSDLVKIALNDMQVQNTILQNVLEVLEAKGYYGVNIDFEYIYPEDKDAYNSFLKTLYDTLNPLGYLVTTAVAPKNKPDQAGLLYEAHDYKAHGEIVDRVILMTYEWGYTYGEPQAVAPINQVELVAEYATTQIPANKILLGIPNYGYDWIIPWQKGTAASTITNVGAVDLAREVGSFIQFDPVQKSPNYTYFEGLNQHEVWFEDASSIYNKFLLVDKLNLGGVSYWTINRYFPQNWLLLNSMFNIAKVI